MRIRALSLLLIHFDLAMPNHLNTDMSSSYVCEKLHIPLTFNVTLNRTVTSLPPGPHRQGAPNSQVWPVWQLQRKLQGECHFDKLFFVVFFGGIATC